MLFRSRFQPVDVEQPDVEDTISILRGIREKLQVHHGVRIRDNALVAAATLSNRYITNRFLPDKAIDLVDEACAMIRTEIDSLPSELDAASRCVMQLEIEETALKREADAASAERLKALQKELQEARTASVGVFLFVELSVSLRYTSILDKTPALPRVVRLASPRLRGRQSLV